MSRKLVTQSDIARETGVSQRAVASVVGRIGNGHGVRVSEATRLRILEVANRLGYRPQRQAQLLRGIRSGMIGMIKGITLHQHGVERAYHASLAIHCSDYGLLTQELLWSSSSDLERVMEIFLDAKVEGVLIAGGTGNADFTLLEKAGIPVVSLGGAKFPKIPYVGADYRQGMRDLTAHLIALGRRRLAYEISCRSFTKEMPANWDVFQRQAGFLDACRAAALEEKDVRILQQPVRDVSFDWFEPGYQAAAALLGSGDLPDALVCQNDFHAFGAQKYFLERGEDLPGRLALTGFDDAAMGRYLPIPLTTVALPAAAMANCAVELLIKLIRGECSPASAPRATLLPCELIVRDSCGANRPLSPR
ncbi:MAG TPA: LacI family DNA-binding transcriptional regulator [Terrimicrobiaceae bacterium]|nr:LacI family DNA-binding transcriptional regulator [Terrimicrobiaceae bacterium]